MNDITLCNQCRRVIKGQIFFHVRRMMCSIRCVDAYEVEKDRRNAPPPMQYSAGENKAEFASIS